MNPRPKKKRIKLKGKAYTDFRKQVAERANFLCADCGRYFPLLVDGGFCQYGCGHVAHIKSKGAGGDDVLENVKWKCFWCHEKERAWKGGMVEI